MWEKEEPSLWGTVTPLDLMGAKMTFRFVDADGTTLDARPAGTGAWQLESFDATGQWREKYKVKQFLISH